MNNLTPKALVQAFCLAVISGTALTSVSYAGTGNLISCEATFNKMTFNRCRLNASPTVDMQPIESTFSFHYNFTCSPGGEHWLEIGVAAPSEHAQYFLFGKSGVLNVTGRGPYTVVDDNPNKTRTISVKDGCKLEIERVDITPSPAAVSERLASYRDEAAGWASALTTAATNHAAFIGVRDGSFCTLISTYRGLSRLFGTHDNVAATLDTGGDPARSILAAAVTAASQNGGFELGSADPVDYLNDNFAPIMAHDAQCSATDPATLVPDISGCHGVGVCKSNVATYKDALSHLRAITDEASVMRRYSTNSSDTAWIDTDKTLIP